MDECLTSYKLPKSLCLKCLDTHGRFSTIFNKGDNFCDLLFAVLHMVPLQRGPTLKGKNLLPVGANSFLLE